MQRSRLTPILALVTVVALGLTPAAGAPIEATAEISDVDLVGAGPTTWDPDDLENICPLTDAYTPVDGGFFGAEDDGFDGGLGIAVNGRSFVDQNGFGDLSGQTFKVGPTKVRGLRVTRTSRALSTSPTLRDLIRLKNRAGHPYVPTISISSNLGSDSASEVELTSSGDAMFRNGDRWVISSDGPTDDPPVTHVFAGKGADAFPQVFDGVDGTLGSDGCVTVNIEVRVPPESTRYLLIFAQMHDPADTSVTAASADAEAFDMRRLNPGLLAGVPHELRGKILNWDLG